MYIDIKPFFLDCGLMNRICGISWISFAEMTDRKFINEGKIAGQFITQQRLGLGRAGERPSLNYWLRDARAGKAEVDFVIQRGKKG